MTINTTETPAEGERIVALLDRLDALHHLDGLVPLPLLRRELGATPRSVVDRTLFDLEQCGRIALKIANNRSAVHEPEQGILLHGRGLIYFARTRAVSPCPVIHVDF